MGGAASFEGENARSESAVRHHSAPSETNPKLATAVTLIAYCALILVAVLHHEPWADEADAWVLSRDLPYHYLVFHELAYVGLPPLWFTILWLATHWFHLPYQALGWIGGLSAIAGCWYFCRYSPFPTWIRVLFPFTYFMAFQFAIVARPYVLLPLFTFAAANAFAAAERRPWKFVASTSALTVLCAPGVMMALGLVAARGWYILRSWREIPPEAKRRLIAAAALFAIVLAFVAYVNWPPADRVTARADRLPDDGSHGLSVLPRDLSVAFLGFALPSAMFLALLGTWCACRRRFLPLALPTTLVLAFFVIVYGNFWHNGALTLIAVAALWIAWPLPGKCTPRLQQGVNALMLVAVAALLTVQVYWTGRTVAMDYSRPYSGSLDAANFLRSVGADRSSTCGFDFHSVALQPYFSGGIYKNWPEGESFWRFEMENKNNQNCYLPTWLVVPICCNYDKSGREFAEHDGYFRTSGYLPVHVSRGALFFEGREIEPTDFVIYKRGH